MSLLEAKRCTPAEFNIYMKARRFRRQERHEDIALMAWRNRQVKSDKKVGKNKYKPTYSTFKEFYDAEKEIKDIMLDGKQDAPKRMTSADMNRILSRTRNKEV